MKILHILLEDINYDARVQKELNTLSKSFEVELLYAGNPEYFYTDIKSHLIEVISPETNRIKFIYWIKKFYSILIFVHKFLKSNEYDVIHSHNIYAGLIAVLLKKNQILVVDFHEMFSEMKHNYWILQKITTLIEPYILRRTNFVIHANESRCQYIKTKYKLLNHNVFINNYATTKFENKFKKLVDLEFIKKNKKIILYQGAVNKGRNLDKIVKNFNNGRNNKILLIVGDGNQLEELKEICKKNNWDRILFYGKVDNSELINVTRYADIGLVTYSNDCLNNYYCAPNKILEYAKASIPVLAIDFPENRKIVNYFDIGRLFKESDLEDISNQIDEMIDSTQYPKWKKNTNYLVQTLNWETEEYKLLSLYSTIDKKFYGN